MIDLIEKIEEETPMFLSIEQIYDKIKILKDRLNDIDRETMQLTQSFYKIAPESKIDPKLLINIILNIVCNYYGISKIDIFSVKRHRNIVRARYFFIYLVRRKTQLTLTEIGGILNRDHTTCTHAIQEINSQLSNKFDDSYRDDYRELMEMYDKNIVKNIVEETEKQKK